MSVLKDSLTGLDGETFAVAKLAGVALTVNYIFLSIASFFTGKSFDMSAYGIGAGAVVAAMGAAIKLTETSEPK